MTMHILIATDLSDRSDRAVARGFRLADALGAEATLYAVVDDALPRAAREAMVERSEAHLRASLGDRAHMIRVDTGQVVETLVGRVNEGDVDLLVTGRHRARALFDAWRPATVESVIRHSRAPVLMVSRPAHDDYRRVLAPIAFSKACLAAVEIARKLAKGADFALHHAWTAPFEGLTGGPQSSLASAVEAEIAELAREWSDRLTAPRLEVEMLHGTLGAVFTEQCRKVDPDLIAVGAHTRPASPTGLGSFAADLVRNPPSDLLFARA